VNISFSLGTAAVTLTTLEHYLDCLVKSRVTGARCYRSGVHAGLVVAWRWHQATDRQSLGHVWSVLELLRQLRPEHVIDARRHDVRPFST
jgi:hypothetical protein